MPSKHHLIAITGASGHIGSKLTDQLLKRGHNVRVIGRDPKKLGNFKSRGAEVATVNLENAHEISRAFRGAAAVFTMIPPKYDAPDFRAFQKKAAEGLATALAQCGATHVVNLSSVGANLDKGTGPILGLHDTELWLNQLKDINILHLRPAYFMENLLVNLDLIRTSGIFGSPLKASLSIPMVATQDIAAVAADLLSSLEFTGSGTREILGAADLSMNQVEKALSAALLKPDLKYVEFSYEDAEKAMAQMGLSPDAARLMVEMTRGFNDSWIKPTEKRSPQNTTPTTIDQFAKFFAQVYNSLPKTAALA